MEWFTKKAHTVYSQSVYKVLIGQTVWIAGTSSNEMICRLVMTSVHELSNKHYSEFDNKLEESTHNGFNKSNQSISASQLDYL